MYIADSKRKAVDDPTPPSANKRVKSSHSDYPEPKKIQALSAHPVPFPEKVSLPCLLKTMAGPSSTFLPLCLIGL